MDVAGAHLGAAIVGMDFDGILWEHHRPEQATRLDTGVHVDDLSTARTGRVDVNSYQSECAAPYAAVGAAIHALHEAHVGAKEGQLLALSGRAAAPRHHPVDVCEPHGPLEVRDCDGPRVDGSGAPGG